MSPALARLGRVRGWFLAGGAAVLVAGWCTAGFVGPAPGQVPAPLSAARSAVASPGAASLENAFVKALKGASPSVVEIATTTALGSGVVYDAAGDVVTNAHVVGSSTSFTVLLANGTKVSASLVGRFTPDDLAVIKLRSPAGTKPATFADSSALQPGDLALAIGSPFGLTGSVTDGIVSSAGRTVSEPSGVVLSDLIQTSAAINPGNSGGALVDLAGNVIGIPTLAATDQAGGSASGIGFAIPSNTVRLIVPQLIASGKVTSAGRASLAIGVSPATDRVGNPAGVYVTAVQAGGAAAKAGIVVGDVITRLADRTVSDVSDLQSILAQLKPGTRASLGILTASGARRNLTIVLGDLAAG